MELAPTLTVLIYASLAAVTAVLGVAPYAFGRRPSLPAIGWANAVAAGLMFGVAYTLLTRGLNQDLAAGGIGAALGLAFVRATHALTGTGELDLATLDAAGAQAAARRYGTRAFLADTLHAAHEGVAIGVAAALSPPLGLSMAVALAVHNVPEATILVRVLLNRGDSLSRAALLAVLSNLNQVVLAVVTFTALAAIPALRPWVAGFAVGALTYLVLEELLPESYRQAGHTSIGVVTVLALGVVVLLAGAA